LASSPPVTCPLNLTCTCDIVPHGNRRGSRPETRETETLMSERVASLLRNCHFELIPSKSTRRRAAALPPGAAVSVTASPTKGMAATIDLAVELARAEFEVTPHISARSTKSTTELEEIAGRLEEAGIGQIFVVGGDDPTAGEFPDAMSLLEALMKMGHHFSSIGVAAYPEGHPKISKERLDSALLDKQAYADYMVTQMCFDTTRLEAWIASQRDRGITLPVLVGVPGAVDGRKLIEIGVRIGVGASLRFLKKNRSVLRLVKPGAFDASQMISDISRIADQPRSNIAGVHIFTFNQIGRTVTWIEKLKARAA